MSDRLLQVVLFLTFSLCLCPMILAQDDAPPGNGDEAPTEKSAAPADGEDSTRQDKPATDQFATLFQEWKDLVTQLRKTREDYQETDDDERAPIRQRFEGLIASAVEMIPRFRVAARNAYIESPNEDRQLTRLLAKFVADDVRRDDYDAAADLSRILIDNQAEEKEIANWAGIAAFANNDFEAASKYLKQAEASAALTDQSQKLLPEVDDYRRFWELEKKLREAESEADDLPRVKLTTSKGEIVVELLENEAPQTVGNFVSLVEDKFYDGLTFHRVIGGFMAQGGCPTGDGTGDPGYAIYCECYQENHRKHFRGTLSMAHSGRDTGGSQFFLTFLPTSHLNGKHTVFGRVIEGMDVLGTLQRFDPNATNQPEPDKIVKAEVLRKRDHEYLPTKVK